MTMLERIARAMSAVSEARNPGMLTYDEWPQYIRDQWAELVRAAVLAMREPTEAMLAAPTMRQWAWRNDERVTDYEMADAWGAMIDAILNEGKDSQ